MKRMKKVATMAITAATVMACATAASAKTTTDYENINADSLKIALIGNASGGNFWGNVESGFNEMVAANGWEGVYWAPSANNASDAGILDLAETALTQGYEVIAPVINDVSIFEDFLARANDAGVLVLAYNSDPGEDYVVAQVGINAYESGKQQGEQIGTFATEMGLEEINYLCMYSFFNNTNQQNTKQGALDGIAETFEGTVNEIGEGESNDNAATAQDAIGSQFIASGDINTIICLDQMSAVGAGAYIEENGKQGEVIACGLSLDADALTRVKDGALSATSSVDSVSMGGSLLGDVVKAVVSGEEFEYTNFPDKIWVLPEDVDTYAEENGIELK